jgi:hypothetical protein
MVNDTVITCTAPPSACQTFPCNVSVEIAELYMGFTYNHINFTYTKGMSCEEGREGGRGFTYNRSVLGERWKRDPMYVSNFLSLLSPFSSDIEPNSNKSHAPALLWVYVAVGVCAGSVVLVVAAGYIYAKRNTNKSARFVDEQSRLINSGLWPLSLLSLSISL